MFNRSRTLLLLFVVFMAGCVTSQQTASVAKPVNKPDKPVLPNVELTGKILYDILLGEIAGYRGHLAISVTALTSAAEKTRDPRLAERATLAAIYAKRYAEAGRNAALWVTLRPESAEAHSALGMVMLETNNVEASIKHFRKVLQISTDKNILKQRFIRIAAVLGHRRNRKSGLKIMRALVQAYPKEAGAQYALAHLAVRVGDLDASLVAINQALKIRPKWHEATLFKARILISKKDPVRIQKFFEQALSDNPGASRLRENYARYLVDIKQWEKALKQFKAVVRRVSNLKSLLYKRSVFATGLLSIQVSNFTQAEKYLLMTLEVSPDNDQARLYLGQVAERQDHFALAAKWYSKVRDTRYVFEAQVRYGVMLAKQGNLIAARSHLHSIKPGSDQERIKLVLAEEQILRSEKKFKEALKVLTSALKLLPKNKELLYARALVAERLDKLDIHERDIREILKQNPDNAHALNALGYTLADKTNRYQEALKLIQRAMVLRPNDPFILDSMGWVHYRLGKIKEAIQYLRKALSIRADAEISAHLGEILWHQGKRGEARSVWKKALRSTPNNDALLDTIKKYK